MKRINISLQTPFRLKSQPRKKKIVKNILLFLFLCLILSCSSKIDEIRTLLDNKKYLEAKNYIEKLDGNEFSKPEIKNLYLEANIGILNQLISKREYASVIEEINKLDQDTKNNPDIEKLNIDAHVETVDDLLKDGKLDSALKFIKETDARIKSNERIQELSTKLNDELRDLFHGWWYGYNTKLTHIKIKVKIITLTKNTFYGKVYFYCYYKKQKDLSWASLNLSNGYFDGEEFSSEAAITYTGRQFQYITGKLKNKSLQITMDLNFCMYPYCSLEWILEKDSAGSKNNL